MPKGKGIYDEENAPKDEPKGGRPGPTDQGREGGMATREQAPDVRGQLKLDMITVPSATHQSLSPPAP